MLHITIPPTMNRKAGKEIASQNEAFVVCLKCGRHWRWKDCTSNLPWTCLVSQRAFAGVFICQICFLEILSAHLQAPPLGTYAIPRASLCSYIFAIHPFCLNFNYFAAAMEGFTNNATQTQTPNGGSQVACGPQVGKPMSGDN